MPAVRSWLLILFGFALLAGVTKACFSLVDYGRDQQKVEDAQAAAALAGQQHKIDQKQSSLDFTHAAAVATHIEAVHTVTFNLEGTINAPEPLPPPTSALVPASVFPAGFSVCWNAASTHDPAAIAACKAVREHGPVPAPAAGTAGHG